MSCCEESKLFCQCEDLKTGQQVTVVFCDRCLKGKIVSIEEGILTLQGKCRCCYYINLDKVLYICGCCTVTQC